jgi:hypothetical protein
VNPALTHEVIIYNDDWHLAQTWCEENVGRFDQDWYKLGIDPVDRLFFAKTQTIWYFRRAEDATMFKLKWA